MTDVEGEGTGAVVVVSGEAHVLLHKHVGVRIRLSGVYSSGDIGGPDTETVTRMGQYAWLYTDGQGVIFEGS
jgi:hypothetical protein